MPIGRSSGRAPPFGASSSVWWNQGQKSRNPGQARRPISRLIDGKPERLAEWRTSWRECLQTISDFMKIGRAELSAYEREYIGRWMESM